MEPPVQRRQRWHPIPFWGLGWTAAPVAFFIALVLLAQERMVTLAILLIALAGLVAFAMPAFVSARRAGSRSPGWEASLWAVASFVGLFLLAETLAEPHRLAKPGDLNINTTESMRARQRSLRRWGLPPEAIERRVRAIATIGAFAFAGGIATASIAGVRRGRSRWSSVLGFGLAAAAAVPVGAYVGLVAVATYFLLPFAGFAGGCTAGAIIERARASLLTTAES